MRRVSIVWLVLLIPILLVPPGGSGASTRTSPGPPPGVIIAAVGDTILGDTPDLPAKPGHYLDDMADALDAQITFGNLEGTLTTASQDKCSSGSSSCFSFRNPPSYGSVFADDGYDVLNSANNHSYDFGDAGVRQTSESLRRAGIKQTGLIGQIAVARANGHSVAFVGFAPYSNVDNLLDLDRAREIVHNADEKADLVVVYMHAGAEGSDRQHVTGSEEYYLGEDRGNPQRFAHMAIDNGADLVLGSGPHVLRGMEIYRHRLIAYSLANFASHHNFNTDGVLALTGVLHVRIGPKGWLKFGRFISAKVNDDGRPFHDYSREAMHLVAKLSREDFPKRGARFTKDGHIVVPR